MKKHFESNSFYLHGKAWQIRAFLKAIANRNCDVRAFTQKETLRSQNRIRLYDK
ncbi:Z-ring formation inhibitor MciZ [Polycladospora coralii]|uniref:Z-ring formation inhibitor MciZ n=1 Tax=Polycladospora coralii TaxID=2771432 RepID=UPI0034E290B7